MSGKHSDVSMRWSHWKYAILWTAVLLFFSTNLFRSENTGSLFENTVNVFYGGLSADHMYRMHVACRKFMHFFNYAVLSYLVLLGLTRSLNPLKHWHPRLALMAVMFCLVIAVLDESHQSFAQFRAGSVRDVWIDMMGAFFIQVFVGVRSRKAR